MTRHPRNIAARSLAKFSLLLALLVAIPLLYVYSLMRPVDVGNTNTMEFEVKKGDSSLTIAKNLQAAHLLRSPLIFRLVVKQAGLGGKLQAGFYQLSPAMSPQDLAVSLTKGMTRSQKLTIPEGFRAEQIAETAGIPTKEFVLAAKGLEGQLFPDTYFLKEGITAQELVGLLHDNFVKKVGEIAPKDLILASLVERETRGVPEKPIVAGILKKRLSAGWPLDLDATIQYVQGNSKEWWPNTTLLDRQLPSKYNTYKNPGLPPTPICNPGLAAINAVRSSEDSPYWFYLHDESGTIHYAATLEAHNANIETYLR